MHNERYAYAIFNIDCLFSNDNRLMHSAMTAMTYVFHICDRQREKTYFLVCLPNEKSNQSDQSSLSLST